MAERKCWRNISWNCFVFSNVLNLDGFAFTEEYCYNRYYQCKRKCANWKCCNFLGKLSYNKSVYFFLQDLTVKLKVWLQAVGRKVHSFCCIVKFNGMCSINVLDNIIYFHISKIIVYKNYFWLYFSHSAYIATLLRRVTWV